MRAKYKYLPNISLLDLASTSQSGPWKHICAAIFTNTEASSIVVNGIRKNIGVGNESLFWHDLWISPQPLKSIFPRLFSITTNPMAFVASQSVWEGFNWVWSFAWNRHLCPQDRIEKTSLDEMLLQVCPVLKYRDRFIWAHSKSGNFSTKSFTFELDKLQLSRLPLCVLPCWAKSIPETNLCILV